MEKIVINVKLSEKQLEERKLLVASLLENTYVKEFLRNNNLDVSFVDYYVGKFTDFVEMKSQCSNCKGLNKCPNDTEGFFHDLVFKNRRLFVELSKCKYQLQKEKEVQHMKNYTISHIKEKMKHVLFNEIDLENETIEYKKVYMGLKEWLYNPTHGLYIYGDVGVGKTHLAASIANTFAKSGKKVAFIKLREFYKLLYVELEDTIEIVQGILEKLYQVDLLVFDEIGSESVSNWIRDEVLYTILNDCIRKSRLVIFTSRFDMNQLFFHYKFNDDGTVNEMNALRIMERINQLSKSLEIQGKNRNYVNIDGGNDLWKKKRK